MTTWTDADLTRFGDAQEVRVAGMRRDGSLRTPVIVWVVRLGDDLYTRSVNGPDATWFRAVQVRHRGEISAGDTVVDVDFTDGGDGVDDETRRRLPPQVRPLSRTGQVDHQPAGALDNAENHSAPT